MSTSSALRTGREDPDEQFKSKMGTQCWACGKKTLNYVQVHGIQAGSSRCLESVGSLGVTKQVYFESHSLIHTSYPEFHKRFSAKEMAHSENIFKKKNKNTWKQIKAFGYMSMRNLKPWF